jgi:hypothetical protein
LAGPDSGSKFAGKRGFPSPTSQHFTEFAEKRRISVPLAATHLDRQFPPENNFDFSKDPIWQDEIPLTAMENRPV